MKTQLLKTFQLIAAAFLLPQLSQAQQTPPESLVSPQSGWWLLLVIGAIALCGLVKMYNKERLVK